MKRIAERFRFSMEKAENYKILHIYVKYKWFFTFIQTFPSIAIILSRGYDCGAQRMFRHDLQVGVLHDEGVYDDH